MAKAQAEREEARQQASTAREDAAKLGGKLEAMQAQIADLKWTPNLRQQFKCDTVQRNG